MNYQEIKKKHSDAYNRIMNECQVFWAFSNEQFKEGLAKLNPPLGEGEKLVDIGAGGFMPKKHFEKFVTCTKRADEVKAKELKGAREEKEKAILYELNNYECFYAGNNLEDVEDVFKGIYTSADILKVFKKYRLTERERQEQHQHD